MQVNRVQIYSPVPVNNTVNFKQKVPDKNKKLSDNTKIGICAGTAIGFGICIYKRKSIKTFLDKLFDKISIRTKDNTKINSDKKYLENIDDIKENFSKIFCKNYTKDEANDLALKYKEIFEIKDNTEFMGKIFTQLSEDYNLPEIPYCIGKVQDNAYAEWGLFNDGITYNKNLLKYSITENNTVNFIEIDRKHLTKSLVHEMKHATQDKLANQVDIQKNITAYIEREQRYNSDFWQNNLRENGNNINETKRILIEKLSAKMLSSYKNLEQLPNTSPLYKKGLDYIECNKNYIRVTDDYYRYRHQLIEEEAFDVGDRIEQIYNWLTNIK